jgi:hypothetical protein
MILPARWETDPTYPPTVSEEPAPSVALAWYTEHTGLAHRHRPLLAVLVDLVDADGHLDPVCATALADELGLGPSGRRSVAHRLEELARADVIDLWRTANGRGAWLALTDWPWLRRHVLDGEPLTAPEGPQSYPQPRAFEPHRAPKRAATARQKRAATARPAPPVTSTVASSNRAVDPALRNRKEGVIYPSFLPPPQKRAVAAGVTPPAGPDELDPEVLGEVVGPLLAVCRQRGQQAHLAAAEDLRRCSRAELEAGVAEALAAVRSGGGRPVHNPVGLLVSTCASWPPPPPPPPRSRPTTAGPTPRPGPAPWAWPTARSGWSTRLAPGRTSRSAWPTPSWPSWRWPPPRRPPASWPTPTRPRRSSSAGRWPSDPANGRADRRRLQRAASPDRRLPAPPVHLAAPPLVAARAAV